MRIRYILPLLLIFIDHRLFLLFAFIALDHLNKYMKRSMAIDLPIDFVVIGLVTLSYYVGLLYSLIFILHGFIIRIMYSSMSSSHFFKQPLLICMAVLASISPLSFAITGIVLYISRYIVEYMLDIMWHGVPDMGRLPVRVANVLVAGIIFTITQNVLFLF